VRIYFSLMMVACWGLFLPGFLCEAEFYLYSSVYTLMFSAVYAPTCPTMHYYYFKKKYSFEVMLKFVTLFQDEVLCLNDRRFDCIPLVCPYDLILFYSRNNPNLLMDWSTQQLVAVFLTLCG
jgi:hypothetical protein